jgi:hypothetical protein
MKRRLSLRRQTNLGAFMSELEIELTCEKGQRTITVTKTDSVFEYQRPKITSVKVDR